VSELSFVSRWQLGSQSKVVTSHHTSGTVLKRYPAILIVTAVGLFFRRGVVRISTGGVIGDV
jgi:hypothetical protein